MKAWSLHEEWQVFRGDSTKKNDLLFRVRRSKVFQMHTDPTSYASRMIINLNIDFAFINCLHSLKKMHSKRYN